MAQSSDANEMVEFVFAILFLVLMATYFLLYSQHLFGLVVTKLVQRLVIGNSAAQPGSAGGSSAIFAVSSIAVAPLRCRVLFKNLTYFDDNMSLKITDGYLTVPFWGNLFSYDHWTPMRAGLCTEQVAHCRCRARIKGLWHDGVILSADHERRKVRVRVGRLHEKVRDAGRGPSAARTAQVPVPGDASGLPPPRQESRRSDDDDDDDDGSASIRNEGLDSTEKVTSLPRDADAAGGVAVDVFDPFEFELSIIDVLLPDARGRVQVHVNGMALTVHNAAGSHDRIAALLGKQQLPRPSSPGTDGGATLGNSGAARRGHKRAASSLGGDEEMRGPLSSAGGSVDGEAPNSSDDAQFSPLERDSSGETATPPPAPGAACAGAAAADDSSQAASSPPRASVDKRKEQARSAFEMLMLLSGCVEFQMSASCVDLGGLGNNHPYMLHLGFERGDGVYFLSEEGVSRLDDYRHVVELTLEGVDCRWVNVNAGLKSRDAPAPPPAVGRPGGGGAATASEGAGRSSMRRRKRSVRGHFYRLAKEANLLLKGELDEVRDGSDSETAPETARRHARTSSAGSDGPGSAAADAASDRDPDATMLQLYGVVLDPRTNAALRIVYWQDTPGVHYSDDPTPTVESLPKRGLEVQIDASEMHYGPWSDFSRAQLQRHLLPLNYQPLATLEPIDGEPRPVGMYEQVIEFVRRTRLIVAFKHKKVAPSPPFGIVDSGRVGTLVLEMDAGSKYVYRMPWICDQSERSMICETYFSFLNCTVRTSFNDAKLLQAPKVEVFMDVLYPELWNRRQQYDVIVRLRDADVWYCSDLQAFMWDLIAAWGYVPQLYHGQSIARYNTWEYNTEEFFPYGQTYEVFLDDSSRVHFGANEGNVCYAADASDADKNSFITVQMARGYVHYQCPLDTYCVSCENEYKYTHYAELVNVEVFASLPVGHPLRPASAEAPSAAPTDTAGSSPRGPPMLAIRTAVLDGYFSSLYQSLAGDQDATQVPTMSSAGLSQRTNSSTLGLSLQCIRGALSGHDARLLGAWYANNFGEHCSAVTPEEYFWMTTAFKGAADGCNLRYPFYLFQTRAEPRRNDLEFFFNMNVTDFDVAIRPAGEAMPGPRLQLILSTADLTVNSSATNSDTTFITSPITMRFPSPSSAEDRDRHISVEFLSVGKSIYFGPHPEYAAFYSAVTGELGSITASLSAAQLADLTVIAEQFASDAAVEDGVLTSSLAAAREVMLERFASFADEQHGAFTRGLRARRSVGPAKAAASTGASAQSGSGEASAGLPSARSSTSLAWRRSRRRWSLLDESRDTRIAFAAFLEHRTSVEDAVSDYAVKSASLSTAPVSVIIHHGAAGCVAAELRRGVQFSSSTLSDTNSNYRSSLMARDVCVRALSKKTPDLLVADMSGEYLEVASLRTGVALRHVLAHPFEGGLHAQFARQRDFVQRMDHQRLAPLDFEGFVHSLLEHRDSREVHPHRFSSGQRLNAADVEELRLDDIDASHQGRSAARHRAAAPSTEESPPEDADQVARDGTLSDISSTSSRATSGEHRGGNESRPSAAAAPIPRARPDSRLRDSSCRRHARQASTGSNTANLVSWRSCRSTMPLQSHAASQDGDADDTFHSFSAGSDTDGVVSEREDTASRSDARPDQESGAWAEGDASQAASASWGGNSNVVKELERSQRTGRGSAERDAAAPPTAPEAAAVAAAASQRPAIEYYRCLRPFDLRTDAHTHQSFIYNFVGGSRSAPAPVAFKARSRNLLHHRFSSASPRPTHSAVRAPGTLSSVDAQAVAPHRDAPAFTVAHRAMTHFHSHIPSASFVAVAAKGPAQTFDSERAHDAARQAQRHKMRSSFSSGAGAVPASESPWDTEDNEPSEFAWAQRAVDNSVRSQSGVTSRHTHVEAIDPLTVFATPRGLKFGLMLHLTFAARLEQLRKGSCSTRASTPGAVAGTTDATDDNDGAAVVVGTKNAERSWRKARSRRWHSQEHIYSVVVHVAEMKLLQQLTANQEMLVGAPTSGKRQQSIFLSHAAARSFQAVVMRSMVPTATSRHRHSGADSTPKAGTSHSANKTSLSIQLQSLALAVQLMSDPSPRPHKLPIALDSLTVDPTLDTVLGAEIAALVVRVKHETFGDAYGTASNVNLGNVGIKVTRDTLFFMQSTQRQLAHIFDHVAGLHRARGPPASPSKGGKPEKMAPASSTRMERDRAAMHRRQNTVQFVDAERPSVEPSPKGAERRHDPGNSSVLDLAAMDDWREDEGGSHAIRADGRDEDGDEVDDFDVADILQLVHSDTAQHLEGSLFIAKFRIEAIDVTKDTQRKCLTVHTDTASVASGESVLVKFTSTVPEAHSESLPELTAVGDTGKLDVALYPSLLHFLVPASQASAGAGATSAGHTPCEPTNATSAGHRPHPPPPPPPPPLAPTVTLIFVCRDNTLTLAHSASNKVTCALRRLSGQYANAGNQKLRQSEGRDDRADLSSPHSVPTASPHYAAGEAHPRTPLGVDDHLSSSFGGQESSAQHMASGISARLRSKLLSQAKKVRERLEGEHFVRSPTLQLSDAAMSESLSIFADGVVVQYVADATLLSSPLHPSRARHPPAAPDVILALRFSHATASAQTVVARGPASADSGEPAGASRMRSFQLNMDDCVADVPYRPNAIEIIHPQYAALVTAWGDAVAQWQQQPASAPRGDSFSSAELGSAMRSSEPPMAVSCSVHGAALRVGLPRGVTSSLHASALLLWAADSPEEDRGTLRFHVQQPTLRSHDPASSNRKPHGAAAEAAPRDVLPLPPLFLFAHRDGARTQVSVMVDYFEALIGTDMLAHALLMYDKIANEVFAMIASSHVAPSEAPVAMGAGFAGESPGSDRAETASEQSGTEAGVRENLSRYAISFAGCRVVFVSSLCELRTTIKGMTANASSAGSGAALHWAGALHGLQLAMLDREDFDSVAEHFDPQSWNGSRGKTGAGAGAMHRHSAAVNKKGRRIDCGYVWGLLDVALQLSNVADPRLISLGQSAAAPSRPLQHPSSQRRFSYSMGGHELGGERGDSSHQAPEGLTAAAAAAAAAASTREVPSGPLVCIRTAVIEPTVVLRPGLVPHLTMLLDEAIAGISVARQEVRGDTVRLREQLQGTLRYQQLLRKSVRLTSSMATNAADYTAFAASSGSGSESPLLGNDTRGSRDAAPPRTLVVVDVYSLLAVAPLGDCVYPGLLRGDTALLQREEAEGRGGAVDRHAMLPAFAAKATAEHINVRALIEPRSNALGSGATQLYREQEEGEGDGDGDGEREGEASATRPRKHSHDGGAALLDIPAQRSPTRSERSDSSHVPTPAATRVVLRGCAKELAAFITDGSRIDPRATKLDALLPRSVVLGGVGVLTERGHEELHRAHNALRVSVVQVNAVRDVVHSGNAPAVTRIQVGCAAPSARVSSLGPQLLSEAMRDVAELPPLPVRYLKQHAYHLARQRERAAAPAQEPPRSWSVPPASPPGQALLEVTVTSIAGGSLKLFSERPVAPAAAEQRRARFPQLQPLQARGRSAQGGAAAPGQTKHLSATERAHSLVAEVPLPSFHVALSHRSEGGSAPTTGAARADVTTCCVNITAEPISATPELAGLLVEWGMWQRRFSEERRERQAIVFALLRHLEEIQQEEAATAAAAAATKQQQQQHGEAQTPSAGSAPSSPSLPPRIATTFINALVPIPRCFASQAALRLFEEAEMRARRQRRTDAAPARSPTPTPGEHAGGSAQPTALLARPVVRCIYVRLSGLSFSLTSAPVTPATAATVRLESGGLLEAVHCSGDLHSDDAAAVLLRAAAASPNAAAEVLRRHAAAGHHLGASATTMVTCRGCAIDVATRMEAKGLEARLPELQVLFSARGNTTKAFVSFPARDGGKRGAELRVRLQQGHQAHQLHMLWRRAAAEATAALPDVRSRLESAISSELRGAQDDLAHVRADSRHELNVGCERLTVSFDLGRGSKVEASAEGTVVAISSTAHSPSAKHSHQQHELPSPLATLHLCTAATRKLHLNADGAITGSASAAEGICLKHMWIAQPVSARPSQNFAAPLLPPVVTSIDRRTQLAAVEIPACVAHFREHHVRDIFAADLRRVRVSVKDRLSTTTGGSHGSGVGPAVRPPEAWVEVEADRYVVGVTAELAPCVANFAAAVHEVLEEQRATAVGRLVTAASQPSGAAGHRRTGSTDLEGSLQHQRDAAAVVTTPPPRPAATSDERRGAAIEGPHAALADFVCSDPAGASVPFASTWMPRVPVGEVTVTLSAGLVSFGCVVMEGTGHAAGRFLTGSDVAAPAANGVVLAVPELRVTFAQCLEAEACDGAAGGAEEGAAAGSLLCAALASRAPNYAVIRERCGVALSTKRALLLDLPRGWTLQRASSISSWQPSQPPPSHQKPPAVAGGASGSVARERAPPALASVQGSAHQWILGCRGANRFEIVATQAVGEADVGYAFDFRHSQPWSGNPHVADFEIINDTVNSFTAQRDPNREGTTAAAAAAARARETGRGPEARTFTALRPVAFSPELRVVGDLSVSIDMVLGWLGVSEGLVPVLLYTAVSDHLEAALAAVDTLVVFHRDDVTNSAVS